MKKCTLGYSDRDSVSWNCTSWWRSVSSEDALCTWLLGCIPNLRWHSLYLFLVKLDRIFGFERDEKKRNSGRGSFRLTALAKFTWHWRFRIVNPTIMHDRIQNFSTIRTTLRLNLSLKKHPIFFKKRDSKIPAYMWLNYMKQAEMLCLLVHPLIIHIILLLMCENVNLIKIIENIMNIIL